MNTLDRIRAAADEARRRGERPRKVHLTVDEARNLEAELTEANPRLAHKIEKQGLRHAVHRLEGLEVVWRSPEFKVSS